METINGEWIMKGCDSSDPSALHVAEELTSLVHTIGFLPLFSNDIPGFSVEERVPAYVWWTGDEATDPWEWRMILARDPDIAYGKFFNKAAGFVSKSFFPTFSNYRRNGYDFDALFEDELASYRAKKIMDVFDPDDENVGKELMSYEVKELAAVDKNFQGTLTDLQMQTYLILSDFRQRKNKKGQTYGWHIAAVETPETKWGREFVTSAYKEDPMESWNRIEERVREHLPSATDETIQRILGIRWPGQNSGETASVKKKEKVRPPKEWIIPSNPKYYDIIHAFDETDAIDWKQGAGIKKGDTVFMYVGAPVSAVLYKCKVMETNIPYQYQDKKRETPPHIRSAASRSPHTSSTSSKRLPLTITALMKIQLLKRYAPEQFTFEVLKSEYGIFAVRGPRGVPNSLSAALKR